MRQKLKNLLFFQAQNEVGIKFERWTIGCRREQFSKLRPENAQVTY